MAESDVIGQLGGFALGEVLTSLSLDRDSIGNVQGRLGVGNAAFSRDSIYNGKFVDDVDEAYDPVTDLEAQVDREMYSEKYHKAGLKAVAAPAKLMRGEEDDFDEDDEDEDEEMEDGTVKVKREQEEGDDPFGSGEEDGEERYREVSAEVIAAPPPMKKVDVKALFPDFDYGKILDFTNLFSTAKRPSKRQKKSFQPVQSESQAGPSGRRC
jgi:hypothetical protein